MDKVKLEVIEFGSIVDRAAETNGYIKFNTPEGVYHILRERLKEIGKFSPYAVQYLFRKNGNTYIFDHWETEDNKIFVQLLDISKLFGEVENTAMDEYLYRLQQEYKAICDSLYINRQAQKTRYVGSSKTLASRIERDENRKKELEELLGISGG